MREVEGVTGTSAYLDTEGHRGTLSGTTFTYEVDVTKEIQEDFLFEAATDPYVNGVLLSAKTTTDGEGNTSYVFDSDGHMIYVDGSGNEGYVNGNDFVLADGSTLPVNHQQRTDGAGHDPLHRPRGSRATSPTASSPTSTARPWKVAARSRRPAPSTLPSRAQAIR